MQTGLRALLKMADKFSGITVISQKKGDRFVDLLFLNGFLSIFLYKESAPAEAELLSTKTGLIH
jgi:hypothetical protein